MSINICKECGKQFEAKSPRVAYCSDIHYRPCPVCGKPVVAKYLSDPPRRCVECKNKGKMVPKARVEIKPIEPAVTEIVEGDVQAGETLMFAVGEKNVKSDTVVPNSAVKEDSDGKFIWNIKVKATPLGNRYIAKKVKVDVSASDTSNSAIEGEVSGYENVVTNSSKALDDGQQVRLTEN